MKSGSNLKDNFEHFFGVSLGSSVRWVDRDSAQFSEVMAHIRRCLVRRLLYPSNYIQQAIGLFPILVSK